MCRRLASPSIRYLLDCWDLESSAIQGALPRQLTVYKYVQWMFEISDAAKRDIEVMDWVSGDIPAEGGG